MALLSIVIPTFNRCKKLEATLDAISPQLADTAEVTVVDNASTDDTSAIAREAADRFPPGAFRYICHPMNLGMSANILRCFEVAKSPWLLILGDDDKPRRDCVSVVANNIADNPGAVLINFASNLLDGQSGGPPRPFVSRGVAALIQDLDCFSNLLFISTTVYRVAAVRESVRDGYLNCDTYGPHVAVMLRAIDRTPDGTAVFSSDRIVDWNSPQAREGWDHRALHASFCRLAKAAPFDQQSLLLDKIRVRHQGADMPPTLRNVVRVLGQSRASAGVYMRHYAELASINPEFSREARRWMACTAAIGSWKEAVARRTCAFYDSLASRLRGGSVAYNDTAHSRYRLSDDGSSHPRH